MEQSSWTQRADLRRSVASSPSHLLPLAGGKEWSIWRRFCLRAPGFAADEVLRLASPVCAELVDDDHLLAETIGSDRDETLLAASARRRETWAKERVRLSSEIRAIARDERFREAITWQNPAILETAIEPLLRAPLSAADSKTRQKEALIANYVQRYGVKNESIGFFGPIGWGEYSEDANSAAIRLRPGQQLLATRRVSFEHWAIVALARAIHTRYPEIDRWLTPRLNPLLRVEGDLVKSPAGTFKLDDPRIASIVASCDGETAPESISLRLGIEIEALLADLRALRKQGLILWTLEIPTINQPYENALRRELEAVTDEELRNNALALVTKLEDAKREVANAAGDSQRLGQARNSFDVLFRELTLTESASRRPGSTYGGRTPLYEDCRRDVELTLGPAVQARMARPLSLILRGARWLAHAVADAYRRDLRDLFTKLRDDRQSSKTGATGATVDFLLFLRAATPLFGNAESVPDSVKKIHAEYQAKWEEILLGGGEDQDGEQNEQNEQNEQKKLRRTSDAIAHLVEVSFPNRKGVLSSPFHSPDLMIAASSAEAIAAGDFELVLGELHAQWNTFEQELFVAEFPNREELEKSLMADTPRGRIGPVIPEGAAGRCWPAHYSHHPLDVTFEHDASRSPRPRSQTVAISDLVVELDAEENELRLRTRDGRRSWEIMKALEYLMTEFDVPLLKSSLTHVPRVMIDGMVITRETWRFSVAVSSSSSSSSSCASFRFAHASDAMDRFRGARAWARTNHLPRFCFFKRDGELKPWFVDFESPLFVEQFCKAVRAATALTVSEMFPDFSQCWLTDGAGRRYTCELRTIAVDMQ
jgi:hypothetical protein